MAHTHAALKIFPGTSNILSTEALTPNERGRDFWKEAVCPAQDAAGSLSRQTPSARRLPASRSYKALRAEV